MKPAVSSTPMRHTWLVLLTTLAIATGLTATAGAQPSAPRDPLRGIAKQQAAHWAGTASGRVRPDDADGGDGGEDALEEADQAASFAFERSAPALSVSADALVAARRQAARMPAARSTTREITGQPANGEPAGYTDPVWSNAGAGERTVSGRVTALAVDGSRIYYAGTADGGVWKSTDAGQHWRPIWDQQNTLSIGALLVTPNHALWVGTGEANTNADSYLGTGIYRSLDGGATFARVGYGEMRNKTAFTLVDDHYGHVYVATNAGLWRHSSTTTTGRWTLLLKPDPNPTGSPYETSFITSVVVRPHTSGRTVLAVLGFRGAAGGPASIAYNGFYLSTTGGGRGSFHKIAPSGAIDDSDIGRTTLAYAADGSRLYAIIESPSMLAAGDATNLQGVFVSASGAPAGPYTKIADSTSLGDSGSALKDLDGYHVGVQSWYNQFLAVDPRNPMHAYVGLEEVFQTTNGGTSFTTASPYWNYGLACGTSCPPTTHADQHAVALTGNGKVVIGYDGGVYSRLTAYQGPGHWSDLNATLHTLQYYDAAAGRLGGGYAYWGGLQDNGTMVLNPRAAQNVEPAGGDGGMVLVDPRNGRRAVGEYTDLAMYSTQDGGHSFRTISPGCGYYPNEDLCDPSARFIAPFEADSHDPNHWVAAGNDVWETAKGFDTQCSVTCDWTNVHSFGLDGAGGYNVGTALTMNGTTIYAGWVDSGANPSPTFRSGIDTNYGGSWHRISSPVLPNRYIAGLEVDRRNAAHVYAIYNGYSRRWIRGGGLGTVFESRDGGTTWRNISGNLPDAPGDSLAIVGGHLVLATDIGLFIASTRSDSHWRRFGNLPHSVIDNVRTIPGARAVVVATHGRGIWRVDLR